MILPTSLEHCILRPWASTDKDALVRSANNRNVWRNLTDSFPHPYTASDADFWLSTASAPGPDLHFAIEFQGTAVGGIGTIAGKGAFRQTCQFGYWLAEPHWGKGIATASAKALVAHLEAERLFARLEAPVFQWNPASMRVLEKVGFAREGVLRKSVTKDNQLIDSVMYAYIVAMPIPPHLAPFWSAFAQSTGVADDARIFEAFCFGDSEQMANELAGLVLRGIKRATAGAMWSFEAEGKRLPQPGDLSIVTNWSGRPLCVIETQTVEVVPFREVTAEFAATEGEGDGSLSYWQSAHRAFFGRECAGAGRAFTETMLVVCERFAVVYRGTSLAA